MSSISVSCPFCEAAMTATPKAVGKVVKCPRCSMDFPVEKPRGADDTAEVTPPLPRSTYGESKHTQSAFFKAGKEVGKHIPSEEFYYTDLAAAAAQALAVISGAFCLTLAVMAIVGGIWLSAVYLAAGAFSCAWFFAVAGAVRAVVHIARRA